jgi:hypothetical protein
LPGWNNCAISGESWKNGGEFQPRKKKKDIAELVVVWTRFQTIENRDGVW